MKQSDTEKQERYSNFQRRYEAYIQDFEAHGFTREQAEFLAGEFSQFEEV